MTKPLLVIKFGGSIITEDSKFETYNPKIVKNLIKGLSLIYETHDLIIVHGAGSFGHYHAKEYGLKQGFKERSQLKGISKTHDSMLKLNSLFLETIQESESIFPISFPPNSITKTKNGEIVKFDLENIKLALQLGLVPVIFGDVVFDSELGITILSGDKIVPFIAEELRPTKIIMLTDVEGVFDDNPTKNQNAQLLATVNLKNEKLISKISQNAESGKTRVTGEMEKKLLALFSVVDSGIETWIISGLNSNNLTRLVLEHVHVGTKLVSE